MNARIESLGLIQQACWLELQQAVEAARPSLAADGAGHVLLATPATARRPSCAHGAARGAGRGPFAGLLHRRPLAQGGADARPAAGTLLAWSERLGWQLRLRVALAVETEGLGVSSRWARLKMSPAAHDYLSPLPPGAPRRWPTASCPSAHRATTSPWCGPRARRSTGWSCTPTATAAPASADGNGAVAGALNRFRTA
jgi:pyridoxamine 5'-phosphate oxidase